MHMPRLLVLSHRNAEAARWKEGTAVISIVTPGDREAELDANNEGVLRLSFDDTHSRGPADTPFSAEQAREVLDFALAHAHCDVIAIHCGAGLSRSAGVALALADLFGWPGVRGPDVPLYNRLVHRAIMDAAQERNLTPPRHA